jgi:uncharacterized protein
MTRVPKALVWTAAAAAALIAAYLAIGSWQAGGLLDSTLRVGAPTAQGSGWPAPRGPADIGYQGDPEQAYGYAFEDVAIPGQLGEFPAWLIPGSGESAASPWAVFVHGIGGRRENGYRFLPTLHEERPAKRSPSRPIFLGSRADHSSASGGGHLRRGTR